jgi:outer membrane protein
MNFESRTKHSIGCAMCVALCIGAMAKGNAQTPNVRKITLVEAVHIAASENPNVQIGLLNTALAKEDQRKALSALLPEASIGISESVQRINIQSNVGTTAGILPQHEGPYQVLALGTHFSAPIFDESLLERYRATQANTTAAVADAKSIREQVVALTVGQYLLCLRRAATVTAAESQVALANRLFKQASDLEDAGAGTGIDTLRAKQKLRVQEQALIVAREEALTSLYGLTRLLNLPPSTDLVLADKGIFDNRSLPQSEQVSIEAAYEQRSEMIALRNRLIAARREQESARAEHLPSLSISGTWSEQGNRPNNLIPVYQYQAGLSIPIFTGGRIRSEIATSTIDINRLNSQEQEFKNVIALEVKTANARLKAALQEVQVADSGLALAKEEVNQAQDRFQAGVADNIEVVTAQDTLAHAYDDQIAALYHANQSRADLERSMGHIEDSYKDAQTLPPVVTSDSSGIVN